MFFWYGFCCLRFIFKRNHTKMSVWIKVLLVSGYLAAIFTIALSISIVYLYDVEKDNLITTQCLVQKCTVVFSQCPVTSCSGSGSNRRCTTYDENCYTAEIIFILNTTERTYIATDSTQYPFEGDADGRCNYYMENSLVTCYYDMRSPGNTLGLNIGRAEAGGISAIVIFTVFDAIFLVLFFISIIFSPKPDIRLPIIHMRKISISICLNKKVDNIEITEIPPV